MDNQACQRMVCCVLSLQARESLEHFQVDPASGISSIDLVDLVDGAVPVDQEGGVDSGMAGTSREKRESE